MPNYSETQFDVFVPATADHLGIDPRSAIVAGASQRCKDTVLVHFEGNRFLASNMTTLTQRCLHAAGRAATRYPTIAKAQFSARELVRVATFDLEALCVDEIFDADRLQAWLGDEPLPVVGERARG